MAVEIPRDLLAPPVVWLKGHNHASMIAHINFAEDVLGPAMRDFIAHPA